MRRVLLHATPAVLCLSFVPAVAQQAISTPILTSVENFRDLSGISASNGGTGFADTTSNNGVLRTGIFYRAQVLTLSGADLATISTLHIGLDIDLRTPSEIATMPDVVPIGATYIKVNIYGTEAPPPTPVISAAASIANFESQYREFVTDPNQRAAFRTVLIDLANESDAALFHCSGGKDRTGWTAALLQSMAGVSPATIMNDYLATNRYTATFINTTLATVRSAQGDQVAAAVAPMLGVQPSFLQAGLDQMIASYGSLNAYLIYGLGLSQADIYVLRAKMVDYLTLPGQGGFAGNAAAGATFLSELQNSPLSGHYTAYNYYLQSAVDAGTLGGVQAQVGGQVHADAASYLLRQPVWIDMAITPYTSGRDLGVGQTQIWLAGLGGYFASDGHAGVANSTEQSVGEVAGATYRVNDRASAYLGIGGEWGSVGSADATANVTTVLATIGGRYGFSTLAAGPYVAAHMNVGWIDYQSQRPLGGGLGTAKGHTSGADYSVRADLGDVIRLAPFIVTPQAGVRMSHVTLGGFNESGSELALGVSGISHTSSDLLVDLDVSLDPRQLDDWTIAPDIALGYELALNSPQVESTGRLYDFTVSQYSAYNSHYLMKAGLGVAAQRNAFAVKAGVNAVHGDRGTGINGQLSVAYTF
ncbi:MAG: tyrosine-protein phosphatase [Acetobacteraceae bacterium]|nr:tyrosine-protein phosphatase [Acetobacteraceae bacterium]